MRRRHAEGAAEAERHLRELQCPPFVAVKVRGRHVSHLVSGERVDVCAEFVCRGVDAAEANVAKRLEEWCDPFKPCTFA